MVSREFETTTELQWKNWNEAFRDLAEDLKRIKNTARTMVSNPTIGLYSFFDELVVLEAGEMGYVTIDGDKERVKKLIKELEKHLFDSNFMKDLQKKSLSIPTRKRINDLRKLSLKIFSIFCENFIDCGIRPKPQKTTEEKIGTNKRGLAY